MGCLILSMVLIQFSYSQYANTTLSNLTPPTQINADLNPLTDKGYNLGSFDHNWNNIYFRGKFFVGNIHAIQIMKDNPNTYVGLNAGSNEFEGGSQAFYNTGIGYFTLNQMSVGSNNTAVGAYALTDGGWNFDHPVSFNTAIGSYALQHTQTSNNTGVGYGALNQNYSGEQNTAVGVSALYNTRDSMNTGIGDHTLFNNVFGKANTGLGSQSLYNNTNGLGNTAVGTKSLYSNQLGQWNTAIGYQSLYNTKASGNVGIGQQSLFNNSNGQSNTSIGSMSMFYNTVGSNNIAIGSQSIYNNVTGSYNVGIGWAALFNNGNSYNVGVGLQAGYHLTTQGTFLGTYADAIDGSFNVTAIGYGAQATADNQVKIGNPAVTSIGGYANWTNFSDGRYKQNIKENVPGLDFINQLKPITYTLNIDGIENAINQQSGFNNSLSKVQASNNSDAEINSLPGRNQTARDIQARQQKAKVVYTGFVAQDVEKAAKNLNYDFSGVDVPKNKNDFYGLRYADFVIPLVKAVQELSQKNNELEQRIAKLENLLTQNSSSQTATLSSATISQNEPNPFYSNSVIHYFLPSTISNARIDITDNLGKLIKSVSIKSGVGNITMDASMLSSGSYQYSLIVDGKVLDTKRMVISK
jgi:hypothetical protein